MNTKQDFESGKRARRAQFGLITVIFIILFTIACYLLAHSMVRHHFMGGGRNNIQSQH